MNYQVAGLSPGRHGIHLHAIGPCVGPAFASAGGHHNPLGARARPREPGRRACRRPAESRRQRAPGAATSMPSADHATLSSGPHRSPTLDGSAVVIHANEDDQVTNPTGNSGATDRLRRDRGGMRRIEMRRGSWR